MRILAIDPSPTIHAYVFWDTETHDFYGPRMGLDLCKDVTAVEYIANFPDLLAVEFPQNYGITAGISVFATAFETGVIFARFGAREKGLFGRPSIKGQIGGRNDSEVNASLRMRHGEAKKGFKLEGVKKDIWAALALAVALDENPNLRRITW